MNQQELQAQEESVNAKIQSLQAQQSGDAVASDDSPTDQATPAPQPQPAVEEPTEQPQGAPEDFNPYAPKPSADQEVQPKGEGDEDFKHKYSVLQGMYNSEVVQVRRENRRLSAENKTLSQRLDEAQSKLSEQEKQQDAVLDDEGLADQFSEYAPEIQALVKRHLDLQRRFRDLSGRVAQVAERRPEPPDDGRPTPEDFESHLDSLLPGWREQNTDQKFISWLYQICPFTGAPWRDSLKAADDARDAATVASIFKEYRRHLFLSQNPQAGAQPGVPAAAQKLRPSPQITPVSRGGMQQLQAEAPRYTVQDWVELQNAAARGEWKHDPEGYRKKEAEIHAALFPKR